MKNEPSSLTIGLYTYTQKNVAYHQIHVAINTASISILQNSRRLNTTLNDGQQNYHCTKHSNILYYNVATQNATHQFSPLTTLKTNSVHSQLTSLTDWLKLIRTGLRSPRSYDH